MTLSKAFDNVVHCTATKPDVQVTVEDLDRMHAARGWARCGYHWVIQPDGTIQAGRPETMAGAHLRHYNQHAIGICYVGGKDKNGKDADTRTPEQKAALHFLLRDLKAATLRPRSAAIATSLTLPRNVPASMQPLNMQT